MNDPCEQAKQKLGGPSALALALGNITPQAVGQWRKIPVERVNDVARVTGIPREKLRPDIFGETA